MDQKESTATKLSSWGNFKINVVVAAMLGAPILVPAVFLWFVLPDSIKYPVVYSFFYQTSMHNVQIEKMPSDCDWSRAPLGDKGCSYKREVGAARDERGHVTFVWTDWKKVEN